MKIVLVRENGKVRILEGNGQVSGNILAMRTRLTSGDIKYYELDYEERVGCPLAGYIAALNQCPELLDKSDLIKAIV
ncbi:hypothetical protein [Clostridium pasteurianum]|uniref:Uncharacterized protein n=1 Tax=Clostridium pasteurianum BC1 TaxID=86416 RepID=R4K1H7_CLOPA|nr:hypothetical protein [Clostridium pasteurianum]AGK95611.1 hypothetical protein Clopa_0563 [Clostridium pasteurianum BC1]